MFRTVGMLHLAIATYLIPTMMGLSAIAADRAVADSQVPLVLADHRGSIATIESDAWSAPLHVVVVTLDDVPVLSPGSDDEDPNLPARIATAIRHPQTGELIQINIVEVAEVSSGEQIRNRRTAVQWLMNGELPFTRDAEIAAALNGESVRRASETAPSFVSDPICWITGEVIVEVFVRIDARVQRTARPNYGIHVVTGFGGISEGLDPETAGDGGDPGGSPDPPDCDGGDPGGCPDPPGARRRSND